MEILIVSILLVVVVGEFFLEAWVARRYSQSRSVWARIFKKQHFSWWRYTLFFGVPLVTVATVLFSFKYEHSALAMFVWFAVVCTFMEWLVGFTYHRVVGKRLWTYDKFNIGGYTSWLSVPIWGILGLVMWFLTWRG